MCKLSDNVEIQTKATQCCRESSSTISRCVKIKAGESLFNRITWLLIPLGQINQQFFMNSRGCGLTSPGEPLFDIYCMISEHHGMSHKETKEGEIFVEEEQI